MKRLLLLGGGHAHVHVLRALAADPWPGGRVLLITPHERQLYSGMVPGLVAGRFADADCVIPLAPLARAAGVELAIGAAVALDAGQRGVALADGRVAEYDLLSIDTGSVMDRDAIPGAREHALFVRPIEAFVRLLPGLWLLAARRPLDVVVIGAGAAGVELAMAFAQRLRALGGGSRVALVTGADGLLAGYPPALARRADRALRHQGVTVLQDRCAEVGAGHVRLGNGARVACDAPVLAIGGSAPPWLAGSGLQLDARGFVATGPTLQSMSHAEVFAAGDVATRSDVVHPRSGVYAVRAGPPLAANLRRFAGGGALQAHMPRNRSLNLLACGDGRALLAWGGWTAQGRWVGVLKDRIDRAFIARHTRVSPAAGT